MSFKNPSQLWSAILSMGVALTVAGCPETPQVVDVPTVDVPNNDSPNPDVPNFDVPNADVPNPPVDVVLPCPAGQERCGMTCVNRQNDSTNCGACGNTCAAGTVCSMGVCEASCRMGLTNCMSSCRDLQNDPTSCGMCGNHCGEGNLNGTAFCRAGACAVTCNAGFGDCDGDPTNGCEVALNSPDHCGACGSACLVPNANPSCDRSGCGVATCRLGFADCNRLAMDGCEANVNNDRLNCGACGRPCDGGQVCSMGMCVATCRAGLTNCGGVCRDLQNDPASCGMCATACPSGANSLPVCVAGACRLLCAVGSGDCDANAANGCETPLNSAANCGSCGLACNVMNGVGSCGGGSCVVNSCNAGFANCNMNPADGCEANSRSDVNNCGACGNVCASANAASTCAAGVCGLGACNAGFGNCDAMAANGCEANLAASAANCGMCGRVCMLANAVAGCAGAACTVAACSAGFGNCDMNAANGCETGLNSSSTNCGACGNVCGAGLSCSGGMCVADPSFRVLTTNANAADCVASPETQGGGAGDQRGILAVTATTVLYSGDSSTIWLPNDSVNTTNAIGRIHDAMVSDLRSGTGYFFANMAGTEPGNGQAGDVTQLIEITDQGVPVVPARAIALSAAIPLQGGGVGFYSGYGRIIVWTGAAWFQVGMPSGVVRPLMGPAPVSPYPCESWAHSGIAEFFGGEQYVVFMTIAGQGLVRQRISNGAITVLQMLSPGDVCSVSISPTRNRWYSQFEAQPSFASVFGERVMMCPATWDSP